jgi:hypothetical protein
VWFYSPGDISSPVTSAKGGCDEKNVLVADKDASAPGPFGLTHCEAAAMADYGRRVNTVDSLTDKAKAAGLSQDEANALGNYLFSLPKADFARETALVREALNSDNPKRALGTYLDLIPARNAAPNRITPAIVRDLVMGVGTSATGNPGGHKGVIGRHQADQAAMTLMEMSDSDYKAVAGALAKTGQGGTVASSAENEAALILKAVAARQNEFEDPKSGALTEVLHFADQIRGEPRNFNVSNTSVLAIDSQGYGLQQHWNNSCGPTTAEMLRADTDPIYALGLNQLDSPHSTGLGAYTIHQGIVLMANSQTPGNGNGINLPPALNSVDEPVTHRTYDAQSVPNTPAGRTAALNQMESLLDQGIDVPIRVQWPGGGGHFQLCTDVQGKPPNRQFLVNDPATGRSAWVSETAIANVTNNNFLAGTGTLTHIYPGADEWWLP